MKNTILLLAILFSGISAQEAGMKDTQRGIADLGWMAGCWEIPGKDAGSFISETWTKPFGTMIGTNRTVRKGSVVAYEFLRIETREDGIYYVAHPSGAKSETGFKLISNEKGKVVFENKEHDFPKRIIYTSEGETEMNARVEDDSKHLSFALKKVACD